MKLRLCFTMDSMDCENFNKLEAAFIEVRRKRAQHFLDRTLTPDVEEQLSRGELRALYEVLDHRAEHGCQHDEGSKAGGRLPASRNLGGIIGPY